MKEGKIIKRLTPSLPFYLVNTGIPLSSTGECVTQVQPFFHRSRRGEDFAAITELMDQALQNQDYKNFHTSIRENHRLLKEIGVVPEKVQRFIAELEEQGGAGKICGAGAVI